MISRKLSTVIALCIGFAVFLLAAINTMNPGTSMGRALMSLSGLHPYAKAHQEVLQLRGLYFGTSRTWGTGLETERTHAYPYMVSLSTTNLAIRGSGPQYPYLCFESMIGEDARFDFVVFEYYGILQGTEARLVDLGKRVRARFPDATMIFLAVQEPNFYQHMPTGQNVQQVIDGAGHFNFKGGAYEPITIGDMFASTTTHQPDEWELRPPQSQKEHLQKAADAVGGFVWSPVTNFGITPASPLHQVRLMGSLYFKGA